jgi:serine/threonine-protein kinase
MPGSGLLGGRYRIEEPPIGQGGMGVVYKGYDVQLKNRLVAVKTIKGPVDDVALEQFRKEWDVLARLSHPNIVNIFDVGEFVDNEGKKPYLVMQLLRGTHLGDLLHANGSRLDPERLVEIMCQVCRGLQEAHKQNVVHRDLKPSNLFVLEDDTVIVIDFGIVHLAGNETRTGLKGTLPYMAPEQLDGKSSPQSDIYSLGVVCYETLTGRKPFDCRSPAELIDAIRSQIPPAISDLNDSVPYSLTQVVHRALAKQPYHRFSSAREFADYLQRALRNEPIPQLDRAKFAPRVTRIKKALTGGDCTYAREMLAELESEGIVDPEISLLRIQTEQAMRARTVYQLLESARFLLEAEDYPLALQKVQNVLELEPSNVDALALKAEIERNSDSSQAKKWYEIGRQHLEHALFSKAREAAEQIRKVDLRLASELLAEIAAREQEHSKLQQERQQLYDSALNAYRNGEISTALSKLEKVIELGKRLFGRAQTDSQYVKLYEEIRSEQDELQRQYAEGTKALEGKEFKKALEICQEVLTRRPDDKLFRALQIQVHDLERQAQSAAIAEIYAQIVAEPDLDKKFQLAKDAVKQFPDEQMFAQALRLVRERRDLVNSIVSRARLYESQGQIPEAVNQWDMLRKIYPQHPGLDYEQKRLSRKQEDFLRDQARVGWLEKIQRALMSGNLKDAESFLGAATLEFPDDPDLINLKKRLDELAGRRNRAKTLLEEGQKLAASGDGLTAIQNLHAARELDEHNPAIVIALMAVLIEHARALVAHDWRAALPFIDEANSIDPADPGIASVSELVEQAKRREQMDRLFGDVANLRARGQTTRAIERLEQGLREFPNDANLLQLLNELRSKRDHSIDLVPAASAREDPKPIAAGNTVEVHSNAAPISQPEQTLADSLAGPEFYKPRRDSSPTLNSDERPKGKARLYAIAGLAAAVLVLLIGVGIRAVTNSGKENLSPKAAGPSDANMAIPTTQTPVLRSSKTPAGPSTGPIRAPEPPIKNPAPTVTDGQRAGRLIPIDFTSDPQPARVKTDYRNQSCLTPCKLRLPEGAYAISISASGYQTKEQFIQLPGNDNFYVRLEKEVKTYVIDSVPTNLKVSVDDEEKGRTPVTLHLTVGNHRLKTEGNGITDIRTITVEEDDLQSTTLTVGGSHPPEKNSNPESQGQATAKDEQNLTAK